MKKIILLTIGGLSLLSLGKAGAQQMYTWQVPNTNFLKGTNWAPSGAPTNGPGAGTIEVFSGTAGAVGFNEHTEASATIGAQDITAGGQLVFGDYNSQTSGDQNMIITISGATVNSIANTMIANTSNSWVVFENDVNATGDTATANTLTLTIGSGNNVIQSSTGSITSIDTSINGAGGITFLGGGGFSTVGGTLELAAGSQYDVTGTAAGNVPLPANAGPFSGVSVATLSGSTNSFSGGLIIGSGSSQSGVVQADGANALPTTGAITVNIASQLLLNGNGTYGGSGQVLTLSGTGVGNSGALATSTGNILTWQGNVALGNTLINVAASGSLTLSGSVGGSGLGKTGSGTLDITGTETYSGGTRITGGTLLLGGGATLGSTSNLLSISGGTLDLGDTTQTVGSLVLGNGAAIQSTGGIGTLNVSSITYGSNDTISGVTINDTNSSGETVGSGSSVSVSGTLSGSSVMVNGTLGGGGTVKAPVTVANGGSTLPGLNGAPKKLTLDLAYNPGSTAAFTISSTTTPDSPRKVTAGTDYDQIVVTGSTNPVLTIGSNVALQFNLGSNPSSVLSTLQSDEATAANPYIGGGANTNLFNYFLFVLGSGSSMGEFNTLSLTDTAGDTLSGAIVYSGTGDRFDGVPSLGDVTVDGSLGSIAVDQEFAISYDGSYGANATDGGDDIVVTAIPEPSSYVMVLSGFGMLAGAQLLRRRRTRI